MVGGTAPLPLDSLRTEKQCSPTEGTVNLIDRSHQPVISVSVIRIPVVRFKQDSLRPHGGGILQIEEHYRRLFVKSRNASSME
jgi:hypothetical protein